MVTDLDPAQRALAELMSELSEEAYFAGWMFELEFALWAALQGGARNYGRLELTDAQLERLAALAAACGGWIVYDDDTEQTWVPTAEWTARFDSARALQRSHG